MLQQTSARCRSSAPRSPPTPEEGSLRVVLEQRFHNPHVEPLSVVYSLPLPADAAVSGFAFRIGDRRIAGEIDRRACARGRFERALLEGRTAALLDEERSSLFTQELGNVPPGEDVVAEITVDQKLHFLPEGAWEWRFPTASAPRYLGSPGRVADADRVAQEVADGPMPVRMTFAVNARDALDGRLPESPSHRLRTSVRGVEQAEAAGVPLDRDIVVRWSVCRPEPGLANRVRTRPRRRDLRARDSRAAVAFAVARRSSRAMSFSCST